MVYTARIYTPGYQPMDDDPPAFESAKSAWEYLADEREREENGIPDDTTEEYSATWHALRAVVAALDAQSADEIRASGIADSGTGAIYGDTPGYDGNHDLGQVYSVTLTPREEEEEEER